MKRISSNMNNDNMQYYTGLREWRMNKLNNQMATQSRIKDLRDDPLAASRSTRYQTKLTRMARYDKNINSVRDTFAIAEGYLMDTNDVLQKIREINVQGANGVYTQQEMSYMAEEVDQLLHRLVVIANSRNADGTMLFGGFDNKVEPYKVTTGHIENGVGEKITSVDYVGNIGRNNIEISEGATVDMNMPGNNVFWAEDQQIYSSLDAGTYQVQQDSRIRIDGETIELTEGDNIYAIISKINNADIAAKARLDPINNSLVIGTTTPHQLWLEDPEGTVLQDLGILKRGAAGVPPLNINDSATLFGGSLFDMVINLRDSLLKGDTAEVGGSALRGIDDAMTNLRNHLAELGAKDHRLEQTSKRIVHMTPDVIAQNSKEVDLDLTQAVTDLKMLEFTHKAALSSAAKILQPTLLDFLR